MTPSKGGNLGLESTDISVKPEISLDTDSLQELSLASSNEYAQLQRRFLFATLVVLVITTTITLLFSNLQTATSICFGGFLGIIYLWLLARSVGKLGKVSKNVSKIQLLVPVVLVLAVSRIPQLDFLPAVAGFLLYKPAMIMQVLLES